MEGGNLGLCLYWSLGGVSKVLWVYFLMTNLKHKSGIQVQERKSMVKWSV